MTALHSRPGREILSAYLVSIFLTIQLVVPALLLRAPRPARFGWQMFAGIKFQPRFAVVSIDGHVAEVTPMEYYGNLRGEIDLSDDRLPSHLCAVTPNIRAVRIVFQGATRDRPC